MRQVILAMLFGLLVHYAAAETDPVVQEEIIVSGTVRDEAGPLPGVSVVLKSNPLRGVSTNENGGFSIQAPENDSLIFSLLGYEELHVAVKETEHLNVTLRPQENRLDEIVVVGYGTQRKENLTGAISNIVEKDIQTTTHSSLAQKLQGKIPGLQIRQNTGGPGDFNTMINVRGFGAPLYIIDGIARDGGSEFQRLNPEDIESISVLKDASAAVFGLNAANGVIIVTTKKGSQGEPQFKYNTVFGIQSPTNIPEMATAAQWMEMRNDAAINAGLPPYMSQEELQKWRQAVPGYESVNWYDKTMRKWSSQHQHTISVQGGTETVTYFASLGYLQEEGLLKSGDINYDKYTMRSNLTARLSQNLNATVQIAGHYDKRDVPTTSIFEILRGTISSLPSHRPYANDNPDYLGLVTDGQSFNPVALADKEVTGYNESVNKSLQSSIVLSYDFPFLKGLQAKALASYDYRNGMDKTLAKSFQLYTYDAENDDYIGTEFRKPTIINNNNSDNNRVTLQAHLLYNTTLAEDHKLGVTLVYEQRKGWGRNSFLQREYEFYTIDQIDMAGLNNQRTGGIETQYGSRSYIGRLTYDFRSKYLLEIAARYDGSYRYHPDRRWGLFPVVSGGWRISEEKFVKDNLAFISNLKIRASYGIVGEDAGNPFQYVPGFAISGGGGYEFMEGDYLNGVAAPAIVNENLTWFESSIKDIGVDIGLFNGKLDMTFDIYQRDRTGLLALRNVSLPNTFGGTLPEENLNSDRVRGIEFSVAHQNQIGEFRYGISGNFNFARTMNVYVERGPFVNSWDRWRNGNAGRWNDAVWMYGLEGQFQSEEEIRYAPIQDGDLGNTRELPGDYKYTDANGDGVIDGNDLLPLAWGGNPKMHYGLTLNASWKGFDVNALLQGSGNYSVRFTHAYATMFWSEGNHPAYFYDRWRKEDPYDPGSQWIPGEWPAARLTQDIGAMYAESPIWRRDASYLRLKSVELGYTFSSEIMKRLKIHTLRIYVNAHNLFTVANPYVKAFDPERIEGTLNTGWVYPLTKSYNLGLNVQF